MHLEPLRQDLSGAGKKMPANAYAPGDLAAYIDHTVLKPEATVEDVRRICEEAKEYKFASVCVNSSYARLVAEQLAGSNVTPCCVIGFPFGAQTPESKRSEAADAVQNGARELDMVINIGAVKSQDWPLVQRDIEAVVAAAAERAKVKVILETCLLTDEEKIRACEIVGLAGAQIALFNGLTLLPVPAQ